MSAARSQGTGTGSASSVDRLHLKEESHRCAIGHRETSAIVNGGGVSQGDQSCGKDQSIAAHESHGWGSCPAHTRKRSPKVACRSFLNADVSLGCVEVCLERVRL